MTAPASAESSKCSNGLNSPPQPPRLTPPNTQMDKGCLIPIPYFTLLCVTIKYPSAVWAQAHMGSLSCICPAEVFLGLKKKKKWAEDVRRGDRGNRAQREKIWTPSRITRLSSLPSDGTTSLLNDFQKPKQEGLGLNSHLRNKTRGEGLEMHLQASRSSLASFVYRVKGDTL